MASETDRPFDPARVADPNFVAPDLVGTIEGWRTWQVKVELPRFGVAPKLESVTHTYYWTPRQVNVAKCEGRGGVRYKKDKEHKHDTPVEECTCGFYTARTLQHLLSMSYHRYDGEFYYGIVGQVANWGKVIVGTQGWRSEKAYPVCLYVPFEALRTHAKPLELAYGVPVRPLNFLKPGRAVL